MSVYVESLKNRLGYNPEEVWNFRLSETVFRGCLFLVHCYFSLHFLYFYFLPWEAFKAIKYRDIDWAIKLYKITIGLRL